MLLFEVQLHLGTSCPGHFETWAEVEDSCKVECSCHVLSPIRHLSSTTMGIESPK